MLSVKFKMNIKLEIEVEAEMDFDFDEIEFGDIDMYVSVISGSDKKRIKLSDALVKALLNHPEFYTEFEEKAKQDFIDKQIYYNSKEN